MLILFSIWETAYSFVLKDIQDQRADVFACLFLIICHGLLTRADRDVFEQLELLRKESERGKWRQVNISAYVYQGKGWGQCLTCGEGKC